MLTDERYKQLMESVGMPNSRSLLLALQQCAMEAALAENANNVGDFILCDKCGERHLIDYGEEVMKDGTKKKTKLLAFYKCGDKAYLAGIKGKRV